MLKRWARFFIWALALCVLLSGCKTPASPTPGGAAAAQEENPCFSDRDFEVGYDESESVLISLNGDTATCASNAVQISGSTITILDEGTYILSGTLNDGTILVRAEKTDKMQIVLNGADIHSETSAAIYIAQADKVFITTAEGTANTLSNGGSFVATDENNVDAALFSKEDLTLNGSGSLIVTSPAGHGIVSKDSLTITSGSYDINCASHALCGKDDVCIANASFTLVSGKDGVHAEHADDAECGYVYIQSGSFSIAAQGDGISASAWMQILDGAFSISSGGGPANAAQRSSSSWGGFAGGGKHGRGGDGSPSSSSSKEESTSMKGIKAAGDLFISGGSFSIQSADDSLHSNANLTISGGTFAIAAGDDALHADDTLTVSDGTIEISESYEGLEGLHIVVSGGDIRLTASDDGLNAAGGTDSSGSGGRDAFGGHGMFSSSSDGSILISGGTLHVTAYGDGIDANGTLEISGGHTVICGPTQGDTATLDYDISAVISGGTFIGTGASGMAQTFSDAQQGVIAVRTGSASADSEIVLADSEGNVLLSHTPELAYAVVILSSPDILSGQTYSLSVGTASAQITAD